MVKMAEDKSSYAWLRDALQCELLMTGGPNRGEIERNLTLKVREILKPFKNLK